MSATTIVFSDSRERANRKLEEIASKIPQEEILGYTRSNFRYELVLKDGSIYYTLIYGDSSRGNKWQYAHIDISVSNKKLLEYFFTQFIPRNGQVGDMRLYCTYFYDQEWLEEQSQSRRNYG